MTNTITEQQKENGYNDFLKSLIPFGSLDIQTAVNVALEVEENGSWAAEQVSEFAESCGMNISDCDPVYCVYDAILQEARNEIDNLIDFDFCNDGAEIYTCGNFMATSYDYANSANLTIKKKLKAKKVKFNELSIKTKWFLSSIDANY